MLSKQASVIAIATSHNIIIKSCCPVRGSKNSIEDPINSANWSYVSFFEGFVVYLFLIYLLIMLL